jgi:hypothetical protein
MPAALLQISSLFLFRQHGPLPDPKFPAEKYLHAGVSDQILEHCIISIQPYYPTYGYNPHYYFISYTRSKTPYPRSKQVSNALWWLKVKGDEQHIPNRSSYSAIKKKMLDIFF